MPTGPSSSASEPPSATEPPLTGRRHSRLTRRAGYLAAWAAAGLIVIGGSSALVMIHKSAPAAHPRAQTAFCGLVACAVLRSDASLSRMPTTAPSSSPSPSPEASTRSAVAAAPAPAPAPEPTPTPRPKHRPRHHPRPRPAPTPTPADPWTSPDPTHTWSPPPWPPPSWPPPDQHHSWSR